uniref:hypothetical protein n=1 Tax=Veillonella magna TaxID=464322 RepID=UPI00402A805A
MSIKRSIVIEEKEKTNEPKEERQVQGRVSVTVGKDTKVLQYVASAPEDREIRTCKADGKTLVMGESQAKSKALDKDLVPE